MKTIVMNDSRAKCVDHCASDDEPKQGSKTMCGRILRGINWYTSPNEFTGKEAFHCKQCVKALNNGVQS